MLNLNLISQADKDTFRFLRYQRAVLYFGGAVSVVVAIFIILLVPSFLFLNFQRQEILRELAVEEATLKTFGVDTIERRIALFNKKTARIGSLGDTGNRVSGILEEFASFAGMVRLTRMKIDFSAQKLTVEGIAPARTTLLSFQRSLEEGGFVEKISTPLSDLVKLVDVVFTLKGTLK